MSYNDLEVRGGKYIDKPNNNPTNIVTPSYFEQIK